MHIRLLALTAASLCLFRPSVTLAQTVADPENVRAEDVAMSPLRDINVKKDDVPPVLEAALVEPYSTHGLGNCRQLSAEIGELDSVLGDDIDVAYAKTGEENVGNSVGAIAKSLISSLVPFRGIIREISGANAHERTWQMALYAGSVRRAFLKGVGEQRGCAYPARSATPEVVTSLAAQRKARDSDDQSEKVDPRTDQVSSSQVTFESVPVVQPTSRR